MQAQYKNKGHINSREDKSGSVSERSYFFPDLQIKVKARNLSEARQIAEMEAGEMGE